MSANPILILFFLFQLVNCDQLCAYYAFSNSSGVTGAYSGAFTINYRYCSDYCCSISYPYPLYSQACCYYNIRYTNFSVVNIIYIFIGVVIFFSLTVSALCSVKKFNKRTVVINSSPPTTVNIIEVDTSNSSPPSYELVQQNRVNLNNTKSIEFSRQSDSVIQLDLNNHRQNASSGSLVLPASHIRPPPTYEQLNQQQIYDINNRFNSA